MSSTESTGSDPIDSVPADTEMKDNSSLKESTSTSTSTSNLPSSTSSSTSSSSSSSSSSIRVPPLYSVGEKVLATIPPLMYMAKILKQEYRQEKWYYFVHYDGWKSRYDEWIEDERIRKNDEAGKLAQNQMKEELEANKKNVKNNKGKENKEKQNNNNSNSKEKELQNGKGKKKKRKLEGDNTVDLDSSSSSSSSSTSTASSSSSSDPKLRVPGILKKQLVTDWENITRKQQLVPLPRSPSVNAIFNEFEFHRLHCFGGATRGSTHEIYVAQTHEVCCALKNYFNRALGAVLLYRFERPQFREWHEKCNAIGEGKNKMLNESEGGGGMTSELSSVYGAEHLLRLFVKLPDLLAATDLGQKDFLNTIKTLQELMMWMEKRAIGGAEGAAAAAAALAASAAQNSSSSSSSSLNSSIPSTSHLNLFAKEYSMTNNDYVKQVEP